MKSQSESAYAMIREKVLSGTLLPGTRLVEQALSTELQVNRGDVRQALTRLCAEGLADRGEKGGYFVKILTERDVEEIHEVRHILETSAVQLIIARATEEDFSELEAIAGHMKMMAEHGYTLGVCEADLKFHTALMKAAGNEKLFDLYLKANIPLSGVHGMKHEITRVKSGYTDDADEHTKIIEHLRNGEAAEAARLLSMGYITLRHGSGGDDGET